MMQMGVEVWYDGRQPKWQMRPQVLCDAPYPPPNIYSIMHPAATFCWFALALTLAICRLPADQPAEYLTNVKAVLRERCFSCHGPLKQESGLRLDTVDLMKKGGDAGPAITPGDALKSHLIQRIAVTNQDERMPPAGEGEAFSPELIAALSNWIDQGANGPKDEKPEPGPAEHWAYQAISAPHISTPLGTSPIDAIIESQLAQQHLKPLPLASPEVLLRRLYFDLIGLPPPLEEIAKLPTQFDEAWYDATVERLLNDPRYGERWGRHWMDIWRYSDWWGLGDQLRNSQLHIWHWRDWIVESLNQDRPYDEMVRLMLAADEYKPDDLADLRATGFLARNYFLFNRNQWLEDTVEHVGKGFLGITMNCAKCHDHKYDPIGHVEYYQMRAIFEPYHVRLDMLDGEADLNRNGIPRAFDGLLDTPTYRFIRGDEHQPDKSQPLSPGVPAFITGLPFHVETVQLPAVAWQPERRPHVVKNLLQIARGNLTQATEQLHEATARFESAQKQFSQSQKGSPPATTERKVLMEEKFQQWNDMLWEKIGGDWSFEPGTLSQNLDGQTRSVLRWKEKLPQDFDVTMRFTIRGGSNYRSVGISFDCVDEQPQVVRASIENEVMVYVSAHGPDPKVQASYFQNGTYHYPADGKASQPIELNRVYQLRLQVRGDLLNASLDDVPYLAWRIPVQRQEGLLQFTVFDALVDFREIKIQTLPADVPLLEPGSQVAMSPEAALKQAELGKQVAEKSLAAAQAEVASITARATAWQARWTREDYETTHVNNIDDEELARLRESETAELQKAIDAQNQAELCSALHRQATAELTKLQSPPKKQDEVAKALMQATESVAAASKKLNDRTGELAPISGSRWSATRFFNSSADDPAVGFPKSSSGRRRALAEWITSRSNPLTARVAVNHIWNRHFGEPLVPTVFDFGLKGPAPTQAPLIDWLAYEFMENGWSMKHLHRVILSSNAYRRSSALSDAGENVKIDPDNRYLWRRNPIRLESQAIRDSILSLAGLLDETRGGPPVMPNEQDNSRRRSLYFFHSNNERNMFLQMFDEALVKECYRRDQNIIPQQALALSNSRLVLDSIPSMVERLSKEGVDESRFIELAFEQYLGFKPQDSEIVACRKAMEQWRALPDEGLGAGSGQRERVMLVWTLINHNDFVTVR
jgi:mono/diheme cytochrome c family protein